MSDASMLTVKAPLVAKFTRPWPLAPKDPTCERPTTIPENSLWMPTPWAETVERWRLRNELVTLLMPYEVAPFTTISTSVRKLSPSTLARPAADPASEEYPRELVSVRFDW